MITMKAAVCDLCHHRQPSLYCCSDSAFLCFDCDSQVHTANFLVARHIRVPICNHDDDDDALSSSSSSTVTKTINWKRTTSSGAADWKTRQVLVSWCARLGGSDSSVIGVAGHAFKVWWVNRNRPYRVGLAASLWFGLMTKEDVPDMKRRIRLLKRLEEISGVPAKSIVVEQSKLVAKTIKDRHQRHLYHQEESWAEC